MSKAHKELKKLNIKDIKLLIKKQTKELSGCFPEEDT